MYGLGYGLSKMTEGASAGALKGRLTQMGLEEKEKTRQAATGYQTAILAQGERGLDIQEQRLAQQADYQQKMLDVQKALGMSKIEAEQYTHGLTTGIGMLKEGYSESARLFLNRLFEHFKQPDQIDKLEKDQPSGEWKATASNGGIFLFNDRTGKIKQIQEPGQAKPSEQITGMKLTAWQAYFKGTATPEQKRLINADTDPYIAQAAKMINDDDRYYALPAEEKAKKAMEIADLMRQANNPAPAAGTGPSLEKMMPGQTYTKTATNPQTGEKIGWNGSQWVPIK